MHDPLPHHRLGLKQMDCSSPKLSPLLLPHLLRCLHFVFAVLFFLGSEMKVALSRRAGISARGNPELHRVGP